MSKDSLIRLTIQLYQLTSLFPRREPLRYKMRKEANEVLANLISCFNSEQFTFSGEVAKKTKSQIAVLDGYFEIAKSQNWAKQEKVLLVQEKYRKIAEELERLQTVETIEPVQTIEEPTLQSQGENETLNFQNSKPLARQEKILEILKEKEKIQVGQLIEYFPTISRRTLIRDLENLIRANQILRQGKGRLACYMFKVTF